MGTTTRKIAVLSVLALLAAPGCAPATPQAGGGAQATAAAEPITGREWLLVSLGSRTSVLGARGEPPTLRLDTEGARASGFAGCNRWSAGYVLRGDSLRFTDPVSTRMACTDAGDVEPVFLSAVTQARTYRATATELALLGASGAEVARFRARPR